MFETAIIVAAIIANTLALIGVAIRIERRLTTLETNQEWLIGHTKHRREKYAGN